MKPCTTCGCTEYHNIAKQNVPQECQALLKAKILVIAMCNNCGTTMTIGKES